MLRLEGFLFLAVRSSIVFTTHVQVSYALLIAPTPVYHELKIYDTRAFDGAHEGAFIRADQIQVERRRQNGVLALSEVDTT